MSSDAKISVVDDEFQDLSGHLLSSGHQDRERLLEKGDREETRGKRSKGKWEGLRA